MQLDFCKTLGLVHQTLITVCNTGFLPLQAEADITQEITSEPQNTSHQYIDFDEQKSADCSFNAQAMFAQVKVEYSRSLQWVPVYDVMEQSQVKFSHCWIHTPMLAQESSWQVVLGPGRRREGGREGFGLGEERGRYQQERTVRRQ